MNLPGLLPALIGGLLLVPQVLGVLKCLSQH